jgi:hypothetical protein
LEPSSSSHTTYRESEEKAGLADARVSDEEKLEQVVAARAREEGAHV